MHSQVTSELLMVRPANFSRNIETLRSNNLQERLQKTDSKNNIQSLALIEVEKMLRILRDHKITVIDIDDIKELNNTDAIFPNNWVTFHQNNTVVLYPMMAHSRRSERRYDILQYLEEYQSYNINRVIDLSYLEEANYFLEGTGSMIFDRVNRIVFASKSSRTSIEALEVFCEELKYKPIIFEAFNNDYPIYHTNVMMSLGKKTAFICSDSIKNEEETFLIKAYLKDSGREIIEITIQQMNQFAGNVIEVQNAKGISHLILSQSAYQALEKRQIDLINDVSKIVPIPLATIEKYGGGSARCMIAEIFLQKN